MVTRSRLESEDPACVLPHQNLQLQVKFSRNTNQPDNGGKRHFRHQNTSVLHGRLLSHSTGYAYCECIERGCGGAKNPEEEWIELLDAFSRDYSGYVRPAEAFLHN